MSFSASELERYARHIVLREFGGVGQAKLKAARVLMVGVGGLGCPALQFLTAAGVGHLRFVDDDVISLSNLQRQILFATDDIGRPKVEAAADRLAALNPEISLEPVNSRFSPEMVDGVDIVLDGSDNFVTRRAVNAACVERGAPLVFAAMDQWEGQMALLDPSRGGPCYNCLFPEDPAEGLAPTCAEAGIIGALAGTMGSMMATLAIKDLVGLTDTQNWKLKIYDALYGEMREIAVFRDPNCPVCGDQGRA